jgi:hypothetical protein
MTTSRRDEGLSEAVGFILIIAFVVLALTVYLLYMLPAMGRENEIGQMSDVKDSFTQYKLNIDTLWTSRQCTTDFGPALTLGSGETGGILGFFPFLSPPKAEAVLAINQRNENITISSNSFFLTGSGGYTENRSIPVYPTTLNLNVNVTPQSFFINLSSADIQTQHGILIDGPTWDIWVNITPRYSYTRRVNISIDPASGGLGNAWWWDEYRWNSSDITVNTYSGTNSIVQNLAVYRGISPSTIYPVDLMNPVYGISSQFQDPQGLAISRNDAVILGSTLFCYGFSPSVSSITMPLGSIEYRSNNLYYTPQTYYYQLGGVFLEQSDGSSMEIPPSISFSMVNSSPVVRIGEILVQGSVTDTQVSGSGPITVTSAVTDIENSPLASGNNTKWVNITVQTSSANISAMWQRTFRTLADQGGLPATVYTNGSASTSTGNFAFINITGSSQLYDIQLTLTQVNVSADYVSEYSPGGISPEWRNVPGYAAPGYTQTPTTTTTTLTTSKSSITFGDPVLFTATVTPTSGPGTPTGSVTFSDGSTQLGTVTLSSGGANLSTSTLAVGAHSITAAYSGNSSFQASTSNTVSVTVTSTPPGGYNPWYDCAWHYRKNITIAATSPVGSLTNFPVLINLASDSGLAAHALPSGDDILFTDSTGTIKIPHEIESYTSSNGALVAWVNVPSLSSGAITSIFMYYGNPSATNQQNPTTVWDSSFKGIWHLKELGVGGQGEFRDSTSNGNNGQGGQAGANPPTRTTGQIGYGQSFTAANDQFIQIPDSASLQIAGPLTIEAWINGNSWADTGGANKSIVARQSGVTVGDAYKMSVYACGAGPCSPYGWFTTKSVTGSSVNTGSWYHLAMNLTSGGTAYIFRNGINVGNTLSCPITIDSNRVIIGGEETGSGNTVNQFFDGVIDEVRISNAARADNWIRTEYLNQNNPGSFYSVNASESFSC